MEWQAINTSSKQTSASLIRQTKVELADQVIALRRRIDELEAGSAKTSDDSPPADLSQRLIDAIEHLSEAFVIFDAAGRLVLCNANFRQIHNYTKEETPPGVLYEELMQLDIDRGCVVTEDSSEAVYTVSQGKQRIFPEKSITFKMADGRMIRVHDRPTAAGGIVSIHKDITAEVEENKIGQQLRQAIEMLPHPVMIYDLDDYVVFFNRAYSDFFSYIQPFEEAAGTHFLDFIQYSIDQPGVVVDPLARKDPQAYRAKRLKRLHNPPSGSFEQFTSGRWQLVSEHRIEDLGFFSIRQDITDRVEAEQALAVAKDEAETANRAKSAFLAAMSHEIRTPMNGVIGLIELLRETVLDAEQFRMTETVRDSAFSLLHIIDDILDFSKIEAGKLEMENIPFSIRDTVEGVAVTLQPNAAKKGVRLRVYIDPKIPEWVMGDSRRVRQILINLVGNAIKFTENKPNRKDYVSIRAEQVMSNNQQKKMAKVRFSVLDTGIGLNEDTLVGLFEPFTQAERSTTRRFGGSGLGLSISKNLASLMNGEITVASELGKGSVFTVELSFEIDRSTPLRDDEPDLSGLRALMVISQDDTSDIANDYLQYKGCVVADSNDLEKVEQIILRAARDGQPYDIVIIGSIWPTEVRDRVINSMRGNPEIKGIGFLVLTGDQITKKGMVLPDMVVVADNPLCRSSFLFAMAMVAGRASPELIEDTKKLTDHVSIAPSVEEAARLGRLILVAEDNVTNQEVILQQLNKLGYAAHVATDGLKALKAWKEGHYALLLADCHMPEMDGYELTAAIRKVEAGTAGHIPIIAITANVIQGEGERCLAAGVDDFLLKPVELHKFKRMLLKWMPGMVEAIPVGENLSHGKMGGGVSGAGIDPSALIKYVGDDPVLHRVLLGKFVDPAKQTAGQIQEAFEIRNAKLIGDLAHKLESSARSIGAHELADTCQALELAGMQEDWNTIDELAPKLAGMVKRVADFIADF